ncbi:hypothetical protein BDM02DRAFT_3193368 [Thelephora ganbajun]|uniref:Uncharacterized protein n=1 Tax=Thelephora ganbajun TaxID=370292 RepID=A0ACB6YY60_THEGA|nr:hypothetical protein BDM02DRAFT_3193368 [Thelephora ganbajun]
MSSFSILASSPANTSPPRRAMIANERSSFFRSWNAMTIAHARGSRHHPYPPPSSVFTRANTAENCDEDFSNLAVNDFVLSHKVTALQKLERLQGLVFARSLLERGTYHAMEGIEVYNGPIEVSMGYTASVGIMLAEEIALTNDVVGAVLVTTRGTVARVSELEDTVRGLETIVRRLKRSHELLRIYMEMELANRNLTINLLRARLNTVAPMEIDLTTEEEEFISAPGTPPTSGNTLTTNISIRIETPELVVPEGVLIPIEDSSEDEDGEGEVVVPDEIDAPEPLGIILPRNTFNWQDERAQGQEEYYRRQREEEERAHEEPEFVPPPLYDDIFPDVIAADRASFGTEATSPLQLVEAVLSQCDEEMLRWAWDEGGSFDDQVWQQAISTLHNQDENCCSREMNNDESVLFQLIQKGIVDMSSFNKNLKGTGVWYSAVIGDQLWAMFERCQATLAQMLTGTNERVSVSSSSNMELAEYELSSDSV